MNSALAVKADESFRDFKLPVPYESKHLDLPEYCQAHPGSGMICVHMALRYYESLGLLNRPLEPLPQLIAHGMDAGYLIAGVGWSHDGIKNTFRDYGINCVREDRVNQQESMVQFADYIERCRDPVLVLFWVDENRSHLILLTGVRFSGDGELLGFFHHDPTTLERDEGNDRFISIPALLQRWRRLAILPCARTM